MGETWMEWVRTLMVSVSLLAGAMQGAVGLTPDVSAGAPSDTADDTTTTTRTSGGDAAAPAPGVPTLPRPGPGASPEPTPAPAPTPAPNPAPTPPPASGSGGGSGTTYYVDCSGSDAASGVGTAQAVRTLSRASGLPLRAGDSLLLKRGCSWSGGQRLDAGWNGSSSNPITIGAYGSGDRPRIVDGKNQGVKVSGTHLVIKDLHVTFGVSATKTVNGCAQPFGDYYGVNFTEGARNVTLTGSVIEKANVGVHLSTDSGSITVHGNVLRNNNVMNVFGGSNPEKDLGAWGVLVRSDGNDIGYNEFNNNVATCPNAIGRMHSNSVEIFEGQRNYIHHNRSYGDRVFSELGGSSSKKASDNRFEYNLHSSSMADARFITTRGGGSHWGPVWRTDVEHNTVVLTGSGSIAVSCGEGCNGDILRMKGNVLVGADKPFFADASPTEADNVYWSPGGQTRVQYAGVNKLYAAGTGVLNGSIVADPQLASGSKPSGGSPAVNRADSSTPRSGADLAGRSRIGTRDAGAYEVG